MPKGFTQQEKEWIAKRLLEAGYKQFSAYGLKKTNIEELAGAAGISKGAFYLFYESKEALFMDVAERVEERFRQEVLAVIDLPGPSPRARLTAALHKAFTLWKEIPILRFFTRSDYDLIIRRVSPEMVQEHLRSDRVFIDEFISRCQKAGIPIQAQADQINGLMYALFLTSMHEDDFGPNNFSGTIDLLVELVAAFCLGEVESHAIYAHRPAFEPE
jgi:AcrR family transcriptional regulator